jgi:hypothetical protein
VEPDIDLIHEKDGKLRVKVNGVDVFKPQTGEVIRKLVCKSQALQCAPVDQRLGDENVADNDKRWQDMNPDEQAVLIRQISGAVNGIQFRVQDLEEAVKALQERLKKP